jgi:two-component system nitrogen regulation response regulator GlnG
VAAELDAGRAASSPGEPLTGDVTISQAVEHNMQDYFRSFGDGLPPPGLYQRVLAELEQPLILATLAATRGNQIRAAEVLGLNRNTLRKKIKEHGFSVFKGAYKTGTGSGLLQCRHILLHVGHSV